MIRMLGQEGKFWSGVDKCMGWAIGKNMKDDGNWDCWYIKYNDMTHSLVENSV